MHRSLGDCVFISLDLVLGNDIVESYDKYVLNFIRNGHTSNLGMVSAAHYPVTIWCWPSFSF